MGFIALVLLALIIGGAVAFSKRQAGGRRPGPGLAQQQMYDADAGAEATRWVERLGGSLSTLDAGDNPAARQALADAAERHQAAQGQLATAYSPAQYALVQQTALEGLHYVRAGRTSLGLDPGPELPRLGTGTVTGNGDRVTVGDQTYAASAQQSAATPYYYPGGVVAGRNVPGGWYSAPWWKTALVAGAAGVGGILLADALLDGFHHHGPHGGGPFGGPGGFGGFGGPGGPGPF
ncbi:hypothetical protein OK074_0684 [Actinobacteria bacterium OK074]|nr:hypothetical protein OK074_0684 [Actinobacteria bacterium OK074]